MRQLQPASTITYTHLQGVLTHKGFSQYICFQASTAVKMYSALFLGILSSVKW